MDYQDLPLSQATMESDETSNTPSDDISSLQSARPLHGRTSGPKRRSSHWTPEEDEILRQAVQQFKGKSWKKIAECFKDRSDVQCLHRWQKVLDPELVKGSWSKEEDDKLIGLVNIHGPKKWSTIAQELAGRIGKQCRERWHNHLNPAINKEAWTQEEELTLIRAHEAHGNKWAELSKYLPGRSDNAIKNHWHSSVKKKRDSYIASGLLAQFPTLPNVNHQNQSIPSSSVMLQQTSEDESVHKEGAEVEEFMECSQGSTLAGCPQSTSDLGNTFVHIRENGGMSEEIIPEKDASSSAAPCPTYYTPAFEDVSCSMLKVPSELVDSNSLEQHTFSHDWGNSTGKDWQFNMDDFTEFIQESSGHYMHWLNGNENHDMVTNPLQSAMESGATSNAGNIVEGPYNPNEMFNPNELFDGSRIEYPEVGIPQCSLSETGVNGSGEPADSLIYQSSNYQIPDTGNMAPQNCNDLSFDYFEASNHQQFSVPLHFSSEDRSLVFGNASDQFHYPPLENPVQESFRSRCDVFICPSEFGSSSNDNGIDNAVLKDHPDYTKDSTRLEEQKDEGALCYEPPRFPSLDAPFLYCDLKQSGSDTQQEYSPLGIRQLMTTSTDCSTPLRLWDSPSRADSPDAILKSAAKTFTGTPSILKKRQRHLVTPLSEKRCEKKLECDLNQELFSNMVTEFPRVDDMFDESANEKASTEDKENLHPSSEDGRKETGDGVTGLSCIGNSERQLDGGGAHYHKELHSECAGANDAMGKVKQPPGVLVELSSNDMLFSPDRFFTKHDRATSLSIKALGNQYARRLEAASSNQATVSSSSVVCSPDVLGKRQSGVVIATSMQYTTSTALENTTENSENIFGADTSNIFGETPFKRSIESPSAWKSPWFTDSLMSSPRYDTELTFEDFAFLMSPGDRSFDAIGLMKQLNEQTAPSIADARQILGSETPETILLGRNSKEQKADENCTLLPSNAMSERRTLDFSECGTPVKGNETTTKFGSNDSVSSPSSYLLKCCR
ncbi:transcription factor MYB3R-4 isoform X1 [Solanum stenotomum]|uniref:transcription factor MYB3R-4 isoform X1 n=1 Tax=Solanum stenotomum TaxID=172797 RepID=UPI0020D1ACAB|nr:transcription factor MYB3R-4 isoform X1 [Solanum stenotomum]XP_049380716.1 transcription factor MYB3R-4 isoform X2 [Solanum stenotomum]XP_049380717.1 transcription factor MYB3R-4 isoform X1 [Solanum stenotomum]XP_049380718.1 transcription factor MYB3R-4 isoform X1 [Solanum stenotomum]